jgi:hypothetical protein
MSTAMLLATFLPAFVSLMSDVGLAGTENLRRRLAASPPADGRTEPTAKEIKEWKEQNGLLLSPGEITTAIIASAAPLLTAPTIDLAKAIVVPT